MTKIQNIEADLNKSRLQSLFSYKESGVIKHVEILTSHDSCDECKKWQGKKLNLEEALVNAPLPVRGCSQKHGYCRCCYLPVVE